MLINLPEYEKESQESQNEVRKPKEKRIYKEINTGEKKKQSQKGKKKEQIRKNVRGGKSRGANQPWPFVII